MFEIWDWEEGRRAKSPGPIRSNFCAMLLALERSIPDDADLERELAGLDWREPVSTLSVWKDHPRHGQDGASRISTELRAPLEALISLQNERLLRLGLKEERLPERLGAFNDAASAKAIGTYGPRAAAWESYLGAAFLRADAKSAATLLGWLGEGARQKFHPRETEESPLSELARAVSAPRASQEAALDVGLEQTGAWSAAWFDSRNKKSEAERSDELKRQAMAGLLPLAAARGNHTLCEALLDRGVAISKRALIEAAGSGEGDIFWRLLEAARADPARFKEGERLAGIKSDRRHWAKQDDEAPLTLLETVTQRLADAAKRGDEHRSKGDARLSEEAGARLGGFLIAAFKDGLALPGDAEGAAIGARRKSLAAMTTLGAALKNKKILSAIDAAEPDARPDELCALFEWGLVERFKTRALTLAEALPTRASGKKERSKELMDGLMECCEAIVKAESGKGRSWASSRLARQKPMKALETLAWLGSKAPGLLGSAGAPLSLAKGSGLLMASELNDGSSEEAAESRFEALTLKVEINEAPAPAAARRGPRV